MGLIEDTFIIVITQVYISLYFQTFLHLLQPFLIFQLLFFVGGWVFFVKQLFRDYEVHHRLVQLIFSTTFSLSCTMFELIIFEIVGVLDSRFVE